MRWAADIQRDLPGIHLREEFAANQQIQEAERASSSIIGTPSDREATSGRCFSDQIEQSRIAMRRPVDASFRCDDECGLETGAVIEVCSWA